MSEENLTNHEPAELDEAQQKQAKKISKKKNIPLEKVEAAKKQAANYPKAQALTLEFTDKLAALGFCVEAVLSIKPNGIIPTFNLRPMDSNEIQHYENVKAAKESANQEKND